MKRSGKLLFGTSLLCISLVATCLISACGGKIDNKPNDTLPARVRNYTFYVREGTIKLPDGKEVWMFGYTDNPQGEMRFPGPAIVAEVGDEVNVTLVNDKDPTQSSKSPNGDGHTIHLHGLDLPSDQDGDPMVSASGSSIHNGHQILYKFTAKDAGTYWYHCHEDGPEHIQMGMYGPLVIYPTGQSNRAYDNTPTFDKEYTFLLSELDSKGHETVKQALNGGSSMNWTNYKPDYFLINGKAWPDTMMDQSTSITAVVGQKVLLRVINGGYLPHSLHTHGYHFQVIGTDGRKLDSPYYKDTLLIGPGERYDLLFDLDQVGRFMVHDHIESNILNAGAYLGGMVSMLNVNRPDGSNPVPMPEMRSGEK